MSTAVEHGAARERVLKDLEIIDSDGHVVEPQALWDDYVEPAYRDELPLEILRKQMAPDLAARLTNPRSLAEALAETAEREEASAYGGQPTWEKQSRTKMQLPGGYDPIARLVDMDAEGIDIAVIYPTQLLFWVEDPNVFGAACRAYNNWLRDYCAAAPQRLYGVGVMPLQDVTAAIGEMDRVLEMGFKAVMIRPAPYIGYQKLYEPVYEPFWQAAETRGCPIAVHPLPFGDMPTVCRGLRLDDDMRTAGDGLFLRQGLSNALDMMVAMAWFVGGGICERHPNLKVAILEGSGGWAPTMLERLDHHFHIFGSVHQKTPPGELFRRQCWISFDPDEKGLAFTAEYLGAERIIWASDYPHPDAKIPGVVDELAEGLEPLSEADRRSIASETARAFYNL